MIHENQIVKISQPQNPRETSKNTNNILSLFGALFSLLLVSMVNLTGLNAANHLPIHPYFSTISMDHHNGIDDERFYPIGFKYDSNPIKTTFVKPFSGFYHEKMEFNNVLLSKLSASFWGTEKWAAPLEKLSKELKELPVVPVIETLDFVKTIETQSEIAEEHSKSIVQKADFPHLQNLEDVSFDFSNLVAQAKAEDKMFFLQFGASWCGPCKKMKKYMKEDPKLKSYIKNNYLHMMVDVEDFDGISLKMLFEVIMLPTIVIFNSDGEIVRKYEEAFSAESFLDVLDYHNDRPAVATLPFVGPINIANNSNTTETSFDWAAINLDELAEQVACNKFANYNYKIY